jgi:hypothetical protein
MTRRIDSELFERMKEFQLDLLFLPGEPAICKHFGCGKVLSMQEKLFGDRCVNHPREPKQLISKTIRPMSNEEYKILFLRLCEKVKRLRAMEKKKEAWKGWLPDDERKKLYQLRKEVGNMIILDEEGAQVYLKHNR